ncbi:MAG: lysoplasmalogenase [Flavihumibacter sp.]|nr:lysoplasmalogenase [Flavihumibacter sp.]
MKVRGWLYLFFLVLTLELFFISTNWAALRLVSKPLLMATLLAWFIAATPKGQSRWVIILALILSWLGDVFLMLEDKNPNFFIAGLSSFLLAHLTYIFFFRQIRKQNTQPLPLNLFTIIGVSIYAVALFFFLSPGLGALKTPVLIYAVTISTMLIMAIHTSSPATKNLAYWLIAGAVLFVCSDSLLAINKFYKPFTTAGFLIMLTYALAQLLIITGAVKYFNSKQPVIK